MMLSKDPATNSPTPGDNSVDRCGQLCTSPSRPATIHRWPARSTTGHVRRPHRTAPLDLC